MYDGNLRKSNAACCMLHSTTLLVTSLRGQSHSNLQCTYDFETDSEQLLMYVRSYIHTYIHTYIAPCVGACRFRVSRTGCVLEQPGMYK